MVEFRSRYTTGRTVFCPYGHQHHEFVSIGNVLAVRCILLCIVAPANAVNFGGGVIPRKKMNWWLFKSRNGFKVWGLNWFRICCPNSFGVILSQLFLASLCWRCMGVCFTWASSMGLLQRDTAFGLMILFFWISLLLELGIWAVKNKLLAQFEPPVHTTTREGWNAGWESNQL